MAFEIPQLDRLLQPGDLRQMHVLANRPTLSSPSIRRWLWTLSKAHSKLIYSAITKLWITGRSSEPLRPKNFHGGGGPPTVDLDRVLYKGDLVDVARIRSNGEPVQSAAQPDIVTRRRPDDSVDDCYTTTSSLLSSHPPIGPEDGKFYFWEDIDREDADWVELSDIMQFWRRVAEQTTIIHQITAATISHDDGRATTEKLLLVDVAATRLGRDRP